MKKLVYITLAILTLHLGVMPIRLWAQNRKAEKIVLENSSLDNLYRIDKDVYRSNQPSTKDFDALERFGIREVLSLRNWNSDNAEARKTANIELHRLKTRASKINERDIIAAMKIINRRNGPILIHCWHGSDRTGAVVAMYRIIYQEWTKQAAIDEMTNGGFGFHSQFSQIIDMINRADIEYIKAKISEN